MKKFVGFEHGMGIGGWLTNYKRFNCLAEDRRMKLTIGDFEHFRTYITEDDVANIKSMGMDHIRLGFDQIVVEEAPGVFRAEIVELIKTFVGWCEKYDLNVVLNLHKALGNYCDIEGSISLLDSEELQEGFIRFWEQMEDEFVDRPDVVFELLNEVRDVEPSVWNNFAEKSIKALRKKNPTRLIIIGCRCWNRPYTLEDLRVYDDENVIYTFHQYEPFCFTHQQGVLQADNLYYNRKVPYPGDVSYYQGFMKLCYNDDDCYSKYDIIDKQCVRDTMQGAMDFIKAHPDKILWCGEFGTIRHINIKQREAWMRDVISILKENEIPYCVWNYLSTPNDGNRFSLVDDDTRKILSPELGEIIKGNV